MFDGLRFDFDGVRVLVSGGAQGIGHAIAKAYAETGAHVTVTGRRAGALDYESDLSAFTYAQLEVTDKNQIRSVAASLGDLDILINNAGGHQNVDESEWAPAGFDGALDVNLSSAFHLSDACLHMLKSSSFSGGASVVSISSSTAYFGYDAAPGYSASKAALIQLTKSFAVSWAKFGIRANAVAPGFVETNLTAPYRESVESKVSATPLKRIGKPDDIAAAVLFLSSPAASCITGQTLGVDGGYTITMP